MSSAARVPMSPDDIGRQAYLKKVQCAMCKQLPENARFTRCCQHCICSGCVAKLLDGKKESECPNCRHCLTAADLSDYSVCNRNWRALLQKFRPILDPPVVLTPPDSARNPDNGGRTAFVCRSESCGTVNLPSDARRANLKKACSESHLQFKICLESLQQVEQKDKVFEWLRNLVPQAELGSAPSSQSPSPPDKEEETKGGGAPDPYEFVPSQRGPAGKPDGENIPEYRPTTRLASAVGDIDVEVDDEFDRLRRGEGDSDGGSSAGWCSKVDRGSKPRVSYGPQKRKGASEEGGNKRKSSAAGSAVLAGASSGWGRAERVSRELKPRRRKCPGALDVSYHRSSTTPAHDVSTLGNFNGFDPELRPFTPRKQILDDFIRRETIEVSREESKAGLEAILPDKFGEKSENTPARRPSTDTTTEVRKKERTQAGRSQSMDERVEHPSDVPDKQQEASEAMDVQPNVLPSRVPDKVGDVKRRTFSLGANTQDLSSAADHSQMTQDKLATVSHQSGRRKRKGPRLEMVSERNYYVVSTGRDGTRADGRIPNAVVAKLFDIMGHKMESVEPGDGIVGILAGSARGEGRDVEVQAEGWRGVDASAQTEDVVVEARFEVDLGFVPVPTADDLALEKVMANVRADLPSGRGAMACMDLECDGSSGERFLDESSVQDMTVGPPVSTQVVRREEASIADLQGQINLLTATGLVGMSTQLDGDMVNGSDDEMDIIESTPRLAESSSNKSSWEPGRVVLATSGLQPADAQRVARLACLLKAEIVAITRDFGRVTHLVMRQSARRRAKKTFKFVLAVAHKKWVVSTAWVDECLARGRPVPEDKYEILDSKGGEGPCLSRTSPQLLFGQLNFQFHILDISKSNSDAVPVDDLKMLLLAAGARLCDSMAAFDRDKCCIVLLQDTGNVDDSRVMATCLDLLYCKNVLTLTCHWAITCIERFTLLPVRAFFPAGCEYSESLIEKLRPRFPDELFAEGTEEEDDDSSDEDN